MASLLALPAETNERIIDFINSPNDVLALGLTCHTFARLAIPNHLHYRKIVVNTVCEDQLWEHLLCHPHLAQNVRSFSVERFGTRRVPPIRDSKHVSTTRNDASCQNACDRLARALSVMPNLHRFRWHTGERSDTLADTQVWNALQAATELREISLFVFRLDVPMSKALPLNTLFASVPCAQLTSLHLSLYLNNYPDSQITEITAFMLGCTSLSDIRLSLRSVDGHPRDLSELFLAAHWKTLNSLHLECVSATHDTVRQFIERHTTLDRLHVRSWEFNLSAVPSGCLPNLRTYYVHDFVHDLPILVRICPPRLEELAFWYLKEGTLPAFKESIAGLPSLKRLLCSRRQTDEFKCTCSFFPMAMACGGL